MDKSTELINEFIDCDDQIRSLQKRQRILYDEIALLLHGVKRDVIVEEVDSCFSLSAKPTGKFFKVLTVCSPSDVKYINHKPSLIAKALKKDGNEAARPATRVYGWQLK